MISSNCYPHLFQPIQIGPVRLNYQKLLPHIEYFAKTLGELLSETLEQE